MRAWQIERFGEPMDVMSIVDVTPPEVVENHVLVDVSATSLNFPDVLAARGEYQVKVPLPFTPGLEVCGRVSAVGAGVTGFAVGDRVIGMPTLPYGGLALRTLIHQRALFDAPPSLDDAQAAALMIGHQTAYAGLQRRAGLRSGETLLVHAASGGVGSAAVQVGKALGARVIAVVGGAAKVPPAVRDGADHVIDRTVDDVATAVRDVIGSDGVDVVFDPVGGAAYAASTKLVAFEGRILLVGFASGEIPAPSLNHALVKNYSIIGLHWGLYLQRGHAFARDVHAQLSRWVAAGLCLPNVSDRLPFEDAVTGLSRLGEGRTTGRIVVEGPRDC